MFDTLLNRINTAGIVAATSLAAVLSHVGSSSSLWPEPRPRNHSPTRISFGPSGWAGAASSAKPPERSPPTIDDSTDSASAPLLQLRPEPPRLDLPSSIIP